MFSDSMHIWTLFDCFVCLYETCYKGSLISKARAGLLCTELGLSAGLFRHLPENCHLHLTHTYNPYHKKLGQLFMDPSSSGLIHEKWGLVPLWHISSYQRSWGIGYISTSLSVLTSLVREKNLTNCRVQNLPWQNWVVKYTFLSDVYFK